MAMSTASAELLTARLDAIEAIRDGAAHVDALHAPVIGPASYTDLRYPYVEILPESSVYQSANEWQHLIRLNIYFERERDRKADHPGDAYLDQLRTTFDAVQAAMSQLSDKTSVVQFIPTNIEDFAGELDDTLILLVSVQFQVTTTVELANSGG